MKGLSHFAVGVAAASCFPAAVAAGAGGNPLYFLLGGVCGLLPDTLDFKFARYLARHDLEVVPDPLRPDPRPIAEAVAWAVHRAWTERRPCAIRLHTICCGPDAWQSYRVRFRTAQRQVEVALGPLLDSGGSPSGPADAPARAADSEPPPPRRAVAPLLCDVKLDYEATVRVDFLEGPTLRMEPLADGRVTPRFIPWHRQWSHSLVMAGLVGSLGAALGSATAGLIAGAAWSLHVLADQLGFMGSSLWFPFRRERVPGRRRLRSDSPLANLLTVWGACLLIFWNLSRPVRWAVPGLNPLNLLCYGLLLPALGLAAGRRLLARPVPRAAERRHA